MFYESQKMQNIDMKYYLAPVSKTGATTFRSSVHAVLVQKFPTGSEGLQAGLFLRVW